LEQISSRKTELEAMASKEAAIEDETADLDLSSYPPKIGKVVARLENPRFAVVAGSWLDKEYAALFRQLKLPAEKLATLKALLTDRLQVATEALQLASAEDLSLDDMPDEKAILSSGTRDIDEAIDSELGDRDYGTFKDYQASLGARRFMVTPFAQHLSSSAEPLTDAQVDQLCAAASAASFGANEVVMRPPGPPIPASLDAAAASALSPAQLQAYQVYKEFWAAKNRTTAFALGDFVAKQSAIANGQAK
jgi:hypothetical protein